MGLGRAVEPGEFGDAWPQPGFPEDGAVPIPEFWRLDPRYCCAVCEQPFPSSRGWYRAGEPVCRRCWEDYPQQRVTIEVKEGTR